jgi:glycerol-3-phosphate acyltransferase PlsY
MGLYAGFGAVFGHNWPVFLKFKGGKGIATTLGLIYAVDFRAGLIANIIAAIIIFTSKYVSLGSIVLVILMPFLFYFFTAGNMEYVVIGIILMSIAIYRHKANIKRLLAGNENKLGKSGK